MYAIRSYYDQQLFQDLGRLRKRVEGTLLEAARDEEIAGAFGRRLGEDRRLDLDEVPLRKRAPNRLVEAVAQTQGALERRPPQVVDAVAQTRGLLRHGVLFDREGRRRGVVQDAELLGLDLDLPRRQLRITSYNVCYTKLLRFRAGIATKTFNWFPLYY